MKNFQIVSFTILMVSIFLYFCNNSRWFDKIKKSLKLKLFKNRISTNLSKRFKETDSNYQKNMIKSFKDNHFTQDRGYDKNYLDSKHGKKAMQDAVYTRFKNTRHRIIPWINSIKKLSNLNIIEVGCGSGTGTCAFAEQVESVIAIDIDANILKVCEDRCKILNLNNVEHHCMEISDYSRLLKSENNDNIIDAVIFYASLEHMSLKQRVLALETSWEMLPVGGLIIILDTPNSLFFYDGHTSGLPFHHWISDELAYRYLEMKPESVFQSELFSAQLTSLKMDEFISWGRSVSYHDFEVSMKRSIESLKFLDSLSKYENKKYYYENKFLTFSKKIRFQKESITKRYINLMSEYQPQLDSSFFRPYLNIILEKD